MDKTQHPHNRTGYLSFGCRCPVCKEAAAAYQREFRERARARINALKDRPCDDCGESFPPYVMDFDHRPGEIKSFSLNKAWARSWGKVQAEIAKCDLVCANCHRERTFGGDRDWGKGVTTSYPGSGRPRTFPKEWTGVDKTRFYRERNRNQ